MHILPAKSGHIIVSDGVATDPIKVQKIATWLTPSSTRDMQSFLGFASYYRQFICDYSVTAKPLYRLTEKNCPFKWTNEC